MTRNLVGLGAALAVTLALAACGDDSDDDTVSDGTTSTTASEQTTSTETEEPPTTSAPGPATSTTTTSAPEPTTSTTAPSPTTTATTTTTVAPATCPEVQGWGTGPRESGPMATDELYLVRVGQHDCYDRVVFDVNGVVDGPQVAGYHVSYVSGDVTADGSGEAVPTAGDAALEVIIRAPIYGTAGHQPWRQPPQVGDAFFSADDLSSWASLSEVTFAGSFEGQTTIAVGARSERPFRVGSFERQGSTHIYVDIAHT